MKREISIHGRGVSCCMNCSRRTSGCHSRCEEYAIEVILTSSLSANTKKARDAYYDLSDFSVDHHDRIRKRTRRKRRKV